MDADRITRLDTLQRDPYPKYAQTRRSPGLTFVAELNAWRHPVACPGSQLAREQVRITLETLTARLPGLRLAPDQDVTLPTMIHRSLAALPVTW
jgi:hypothetical protein